MNAKLSILLTFLVAAGNTFAQRPDARPMNELRKPSARFGVYLNEKADVDDLADDLKNIEYTAGTGLYHGRSGDWGYTVGLRYRLNELDVEGFDFLEDQTLHRFELPLTLRWQQEGKKFRFWSRFRPGLASDLEKVDEEDLTYSFILAGSYQMSESLSWTFGAYVSQDLGGEQLWPSVGLVWDPDPTWRLNVTPPNITLSHQPTDDLILKLSAWPGGGSWNLDTDEGDRNVGLRSVHTGLGIEYKLANRIWLSVWGGYNVFQSLEIENERDRKIFEEDADPSGFVYTGLRITAW
ncbi:MAG: DUF6268 family outer membrane beta-barrel protein [Verrucomicrobiota bacterium]